MRKLGRLSKKESRFIEEALFLLRVTNRLLKAGAFDSDSAEFKKIKAIIEEWHRLYHREQH
jgi:hypothetical protein